MAKAASRSYAEAASQSHTGRPGRIKWTDHMIQDLLSWKEKAIRLTNSENPPLLRNGRKKGYVSSMKELWDNLGKVGLGLSAQNLCNHAAKADRNLESTSSDGVFASIEAPIHPEPKFIKHKCRQMLAVRLHISLNQAGVLHMKDQEQIVRRPQRQAPIHWENTRGLITA